MIKSISYVRTTGTENHAQNRALKQQANWNLPKIIPAFIKHKYHRQTHKKLFTFKNCWQNKRNSRLFTDPFFAWVNLCCSVSAAGIQTMMSLWTSNTSSPSSQMTRTFCYPSVPLITPLWRVDSGQRGGQINIVANRLFQMDMELIHVKFECLRWEEQMQDQRYKADNHVGIRWKRSTPRSLWITDILIKRVLHKVGTFFKLKHL